MDARSSALARRSIGRAASPKYAHAAHFIREKRRKHLFVFKFEIWSQIISSPAKFMRVRLLFLCKIYSCDFLNTASVLPNLTYAGVDTRANLTLFAEIWPASRALKFSARVRRILLAKK